MTERSPDVAPVFLVGVNGVLHEIGCVFACGICKAGRVQLCIAGAAAVVDLDATACAVCAIAAVGIARDHRVDMRSVFFILIGNNSTEFRGEVFVCSRQ